MAGSEHFTQIWDADIDWVTLSSDGDEGWAAYAQAFDDISKIQDAQEKNKPVMGRMHGYDMLRVGHVALGRKTGSQLLMVSNWLVASTIDILSGLPGKCTRIDLAVTVEFPYPTTDLVKQSWDNLPSLAVEEVGFRNYTIIQNKNGGSTLGIGKRRSPMYGRFYDKSAEIGLPQICTVWRYEVEYKDYASKDIWVALRNRNDKKERIGTQVWTWFSERSVTPVFIPTNVASAIETSRKYNGEADTLKWLSRQVAPALNRLLQKGLEEQVSSALGVQIKMFTEEEFYQEKGYDNGTR